MDGPNAWVSGAGNDVEQSTPAWYRTLLAHPDDVWIHLGSLRLPVRVEELREDAGRERLQKLPMLSDYRGATRRLVPILRLTPD